MSMKSKICHQNKISRLKLSCVNFQLINQIAESSSQTDGGSSADKRRLQSSPGFRWLFKFVALRLMWALRDLPVVAVKGFRSLF